MVRRYKPAALCANTLYAPLTDFAIDKDYKVYIGYLPNEDAL